MKALVKDLGPDGQKELQDEVLARLSIAKGVMRAWDGRNPEAMEDERFLVMSQVNEACLAGLGFAADAIASNRLVKAAQDRRNPR